MGTIDANTALSIEGIKLIAACDLYDGRLTQAQEEWGKESPIVTTRDYRELIAREDVDAVIVAVPDHWHKNISIDAMRAGKAVYVEKPMVHSLEEGLEMIRVQHETGQTLEVGSQGMSSLGNEKARELYAQGVIGELNYAEGFWARNSPNGAWQYEIPEDASPETVGWDTFLGDAPRVPFDPIRFFRWRNYYDYGTGVSGDLFVHLFSSLHSIVSSKGPNKIQATGGLRFWKDGRDAPDVVLGMFDYPETENHPPFNLSLRCNFVDGTSGSTYLRLVGNEGSMDVTWTDVTVRLNKKSDPNQDPFAQAKEEEGNGGDIITEEKFDNFELSIEFQLSPVANSGILYRVVESEGEPIWHNAPEYQVLDDTAYIEMGTMDMFKHLTGDNYDLHSSVETASNPLGEWNHAKIVVNGAHVEHWLNGVQTVAYELWTTEWEALVSASKFADYPGYGRSTSGHIGLQDHGHTLRYRNIKIRPIEQ